MPTVAFWNEPGPQHRKPKLLPPGQGRRLVQPFQCDHALLPLHEDPPLGCVPRPFTSIDRGHRKTAHTPPWQKKCFETSSLPLSLGSRLPELLAQHALERLPRG